ncbi:MAG: hypothetical protein K2X48_07600 [Chitinophagaceae bacterium]|nr:hypothetical protein [Chitinophagaceae bacterium]
MSIPKLALHDVFKEDNSVFGKLVAIERNLDEDSLNELYLLAKKKMALKLAAEFENSIPDEMRMSEEEAIALSKEIHKND